ncbi:TPA: YdcF family protein [Candidatus Poribacteria bacterium]|jgi:uncharacterized SAM-binding protein YcdF (DUF218 family)|nr:YdcF family protein [Candidatus Poribacteria bacterium]HIB88022.1 YdcF family protein [Candidatus Poribacteria bacterium]HIC03579.1 YdcF family protein [Candidatus Poribacteria bacterium]HIO05339.1 YdcF family protein [Candidatus Poribacteria bacterium]HIO49887.1 YdcF family protein [Candidatus Poribacteria bacterium]
MDLFLQMIEYIRLKKKWFILSCLAIILLVGAVLPYQFWLTRLAMVLIVQTDSLQPVDTIIILAGDAERFQHGVSLYESEYAPHIIFTSDSAPLLLVDLHINWEEITTNAIKKAGISEGSTSLVLSTSTYDDAKYSYQLMQEKGFQSAIVVSSPYHMRRVRMIFNKIYKNSGIELQYSPVENSWFSVEKWWTRERELVTINNEYIKLIFYRLKY